MDEVKQRLLAQCALGDVGAAKELYRLAGRQEDWKAALIALRVLSTDPSHGNSEIDLEDIVKNKFEQYLMRLIRPQSYHTESDYIQNSLRDYIQGIKGFYQTSQVCLFDTKLDNHTSLTSIDSIFPSSLDRQPYIECDTYFMFYLYVRDPDFNDSSLRVDLEIQVSHQFLSPYSSYESFQNHNSIYFQGGISSILADKLHSHFDFSQHLRNDDRKFCKFSVSLPRKPPYQMMMRCDLINKVYFG